MSYLFNMLFLFLITNIFTEDDEEKYIINEDGQDCSFATSNPISEDDCTKYHTENISCCFVTIYKEDNTTENKCWPIEKDLRYFLNYIDTFNYKQYKNIKAHFSCNQKEQTCGVNSPKEIYECSEHSTNSKSCCYLYTPNLTDCIISQTKFDDNTNKTIFDNIYVICTGHYLLSKIVYVFFAFEFYLL